MNLCKISDSRPLEIKNKKFFFETDSYVILSLKNSLQRDLKLDFVVYSGTAATED